MARQCTKCDEVKPLDDFYLICYGRNGACKACVRAKNKAYYEANKAKVAAKHKARRGAPVDEGALERRQARPHSERYAERREKVNVRKAERNGTEEEFLARQLVDQQFYRAFKARASDLGPSFTSCSNEMLDLWLEFQFRAGMSLDNYGEAWSFDHVIPRSQFALALHGAWGPALQCHHWSNLRPVLGRENSMKSSKLDAQEVERQGVRAYLFRLFFTTSDTMRGNNA